MLSLPVHEHGLSLHVFKPYWLSLLSILVFSIFLEQSSMLFLIMVSDCSLLTRRPGRPTPAGLLQFSLILAEFW